MYSKNEPEERYSVDRGEDLWERATIVEEFNWDADVAGIVGAALWPRAMPNHMVVVPNGELGLAAATIANGRLVDDLFATLL